MAGYVGKILRVNLSSGEISKEDLDLAKAKKFFGGRGLAGMMLSEEIAHDVDPLGPDNKIFFATGPLTGAPVPTGSRYMVVTKSPLNNTIASSNSGGYWGPELKFAGYDMLVVEGKADKPTAIFIKDDEVELRSAENVWGKVTSETTKTLLEEFGDPKAKVMCIGPAGEKLSLNACVMNDLFRAAGRTGVGAVMGSKNLKAVVVKGSSKVELADPDKVKEVLSNTTKKIRENGLTGQGLPTYGTALLVNVINESGVYPTNNFQQAYFPTAEKTSGETLAEKYLVKKDPCYRCPIACGRYCKVDDVEGGGPEYETIWAYGADCGVDDLGAIIKANYFCNEYGLDTIAAGCTIAAAMELYEKGYIKEEELAGGPELKFGSSEAIQYYTKAMGLSEGLGAKLAWGSYRLTESYGVPELSMSVKKQDMPAYDPRAIQGMGLQYATANRGGCHVRGYLVAPEIAGIPEKLDRFTMEGKASWAKLFQDLFAAIDSLGLCIFTSFALGADDYAAMFSAATGEEITGADLMKVGDRVWNVEKIFNLANGYTKADDTLPKRLLEEPIPEGPSQGHVNKLAEALPEYYKIRGWDEEGVPTEEKLAELGLAVEKLPRFKLA
ncbi:MAG: aldehyde ferredoxin oxidoreductase family protein [Bacillota bacterium]